jgi:hypothetical protein
MAENSDVLDFPAGRFDRVERQLDEVTTWLGAVERMSQACMVTWPR